MTRMLSLLMALAFMAGCAGDLTKPSVDDTDFTDLAGLDAKSDAFSAKMTLLGDLSADEAQLVDYTPQPEYRAFRIVAQLGDRLDAKVESSEPGVDPFVWLLDEEFNVLRKDDDGAGDLNARIRATLTRGGTFYLVFKELYGVDATFSVMVTGISAHQGPVEELDEFNNLTNEAKMRVLFPDYDGAEAVDYELAPEFTSLPLRITEELTGEARERVLDIYRDFRNDGFANGADDVPTVEKLVRGGRIWAITLANGGRSYGNWVSVIVLDADGLAIGGWGYAD